MRLDRLITLGFVSPLRRAGAALSSPTTLRRLPILMYHSVADETETGVAPYYKVCVSPHRFAEHMQWLADWGYRGVTLTEGLQALQDPAPGRAPSHSAPAQPVAITFDDGFHDFHSAALPVLRQHGFTATMYLPTAFIGEERGKFKGRDCLTWSEVRALRQEGMEFGSHTVNHPELVRSGWPAIEHELSESKATIEQQVGAPVVSFAYPFAFPSADRAFTTRLRQVLDATGYATCVTTEIGTALAGDDPLRLRRLPANECDDAALFRAKLTGSYDWLHAAQGGVKQLKKRFS